MNTYELATKTAITQYRKSDLCGLLCGEKPFGSRHWEYPWAVGQSGILEKAPLRILDVAPDFTFPYAGFLEDHHQTTFIDLAQREWADALVWGATTAELAQRSDYRIMDVREMKFDDGIFDVIFCISVLEHIVCPTQDPDHPEIGRLFSSSAAVPALKEMRRCLKPGGKLVLTVDIYGGEKWKPYFDRWDVFRDIELAGFRMEIRQPFDREKAFQDAETFISRFHGPYITLGFSLEK